MLSLFPQMEGLPSSSLKWDLSDLRKSCSNGSVNNFALAACPIDLSGSNSALNEILKSPTVYFRVHEQFWFPWIVDGSNTSSAIVVSTQGALEALIDPVSKQTSPIGGIRASKLEAVSLPGGVQPMTEVNAVYSSTDIHQLNAVQFTFRYGCMISRPGAAPFGSAMPYWTVQGIEVSNSPAFP